MSLIKISKPSSARIPVVGLILMLIATLMFVSSGSATDEQTQAPAADNPFPQVTISTSMGDIVLELDRDRAPVSVDNFLTYVNDSFYTDTIFHRVIEGFMIQAVDSPQIMSVKQRVMRFATRPTMG